MYSRRKVLRELNFRGGEKESLGITKKSEIRWLFTKNFYVDNDKEFRDAAKDKRRIVCVENVSPKEWSGLLAFVRKQTFSEFTPSTKFGNQVLLHEAAKLSTCGTDKRHN